MRISHSARPAPVETAADGGDSRNRCTRERRQPRAPARCDGHQVEEVDWRQSGRCAAAADGAADGEERARDQQASHRPASRPGATRRSGSGVHLDVGADAGMNIGGSRVWRRVRPRVRLVEVERREKNRRRTPSPRRASRRGNREERGEGATLPSPTSFQSEGPTAIGRAGGPGRSAAARPARSADSVRRSTSAVISAPAWRAVAGRWRCAHRARRTSPPPSPAVGGRGHLCVHQAFAEGRPGSRRELGPNPPQRGDRAPSATRIA